MIKWIIKKKTPQSGNHLPTLDLCNPEDGWLIVDIVGWLVNLLVAWTSRHPRLWFPTDIGPLVAVAVTLFPYLLTSNKALHLVDMFWVFILDANRISRCFIDDRSHHRQWQELTKFFSRCVLCTHCLQLKSEFWEFSFKSQKRWLPIRITTW